MRITTTLCQLCARPLANSPATIARVSPRMINSGITSSTRTRLLTRPLASHQSTLGSWQSRRLITIRAQAPEAPSEDFEPVEEGDDTIELTESAIKQITAAQNKASNPDLALRVAVESGGCHGYQYKMEVTPRRDPDDYLFQPEASPAKLLIDSSSLALLSGSQIDYATELIGSSFRVSNNPHASDKGGCGCGVSWELKE